MYFCGQFDVAISALLGLLRKTFSMVLRTGTAASVGNERDSILTHGVMAVSGTISNVVYWKKKRRANDPNPSAGL